MCDLSTKSAEEKIEGHKIVARKPNGKRYFSIAMGFQFPLDGHVPVAKNQHQIYLEFVDLISKGSAAYRDHMVGRTSIFLSLADALSQYRHWEREVKKGYKLVIVHSEVSVDVMLGSYGILQVAAGRRIHFIEELDRYR